MINKIVFDSDVFSGENLVSLACGHISLNQIVFTKQNVAVNIETRTGEVEFFDLQENKLLSAKVEIPQSGDERFSEVKCSATAENITLGFPQYTYKDNYPNCDGEYDRWTKTISGFRFLCYDFKNNCIIE